MGTIGFVDLIESFQMSTNTCMRSLLVYCVRGDDMGTIGFRAFK